MRAQIIANKSESDPGLVGEALVERGFSLEIGHRRGLEPHDFRPENADLLVLLGSGWSVYDPKVAEFVNNETAVLRAWLEAQKPVLAICFGAQLAAQALGARVSRAPAPEIGWHAMTSQVPEIGSGPWMQWHYDVFQVPEGAKSLAMNPMGPQAFSMDNLLAVQFHPEATESIVSVWSSDEGANELEAVGLERATLLERTNREVNRTRDLTKRLVAWHLEGMQRV